jgi:hypothetical protein
MPTSRSPKRGIEPPGEPARPRFVLPIVLIVVAAVAGVAVIAMPASLVARFLPPFVGAADFSGTLWHGSAGRITVDGRDAGAAEWHLHPLPLLRLTLSADVRWVKTGFVADAAVQVDRGGLRARRLAGDGPIEDLAHLGVPPGWRGSASLRFTDLEVAFIDGSAVLVSAVGDVSVETLASPQIADGADLGGYVLHLLDRALRPATDVTAQLSDSGGPLEVNADIRFNAANRSGTLAGTIKERAGAGRELRALLENLAQLHARDAQGRIPFELEFTL